MAQADGRHARADRPQIDGICRNRRWRRKGAQGAAGMRLRAGDWRVLFTIEADTITIHAVGHRRDIYD
jgi:mRNA-degrading endonuclease RelE of RelBE toxin-antitoxin system